MRILVVHAWLKGNLGDVLQLSVLLSALRALKPDRLDLAGYPTPPSASTAAMVAGVDQLIADPFWWFWKFMPTAVARVAIAPRWTAQRRALFAGYDAVVCAPGPYLASYDPRAVPALADVGIAIDAGLPVILSSHSIGPLTTGQVADVCRASVCVAREASTFSYLAERGCASVLSADYAFLYPYGEAIEAPTVTRPYEVVFMRSNNLASRELRLESGRLYHGDRPLAGAPGIRVVLATSDARRDARFVSRLSRRFGLEAAICRTVPELIRLIAGAQRVVSDRYHPAICAAVLGKPVTVVPNREPHKMDGLMQLLSTRTVDELQSLARSGLAAVRTGLMSVH